MNEIAVVLGISLLAFIILYFASTLRDEHRILKLFLQLVIFGFLILVPKVMMDNNDHCELVLNSTVESHVYGNNFTDDGSHWAHTTFEPNPSWNYDQEAYLFNISTERTYEWYCEDNSHTTTLTSYKLMISILIVVSLYVFVSLIKAVFDVYKRRGQKNW